MAIKKRTDQLPAILSGDVDNNDLMYLVHENAQAETGYDSKKILVSDVGRKLNNGVEYVTELPSFPPGDQNPLDALEYLNLKINDLYPVDSASGSIANFTTSLALPLVALKAYIQAQGGGGTPSSPVAVTGWDSVKITRAKKNLANVEDATSISTQTVLGTIELPAGSYTMSANCKNNGSITCYLTLRQGSTTKALITINANENTRKNVSFTLTEKATYSFVCSGASSGYNFDISDIQIELGSTATDYESYSATDYTIQLGQTIYGGYVDWKNGKLVVTQGYATFDGSNDEVWSYYSGNKGFYISIDDMKSGQNQEGNCSHFPIETAYSRLGVRIGNNNNRAYFNQITESISGVTSDVDSWLTWLSNNPVMLVYPLENPIEIDLTTPTMPQTISGVQNWFADSGDIELEYKMGVQEYIDKKIAETQALIL